MYTAENLMGGFGDLTAKRAGTEPWGTPKLEYIEKEIRGPARRMMGRN